MNVWHTLAFNCPHIGQGRAFAGKAWACNWPRTWRALIRTSHSSTISCGKSSHVPSLHIAAETISVELNFHDKINIWQIKPNQLHCSWINYKPVMLISTNFFVTAVAKEMAALSTHHLIATFSSRDSYLARWALLSITENLCHTSKFIYHIKLFTSLFRHKMGWILALLHS